jgi:hypothetical protein
VGGVNSQVGNIANGNYGLPVGTNACGINILSSFTANLTQCTSEHNNGVGINLGPYCQAATLIENYTESSKLTGLNIAFDAASGANSPQYPSITNNIYSITSIGGQHIDSISIGTQCAGVQIIGNKIGDLYAYGVGTVVMGPLITGTLYNGDPQFFYLRTVPTGAAGNSATSYSLLPYLTFSGSVSSSTTPFVGPISQNLSQAGGSFFVAKSYDGSGTVEFGIANASNTYGIGEGKNDGLAFVGAGQKWRMGAYLDGQNYQEALKFGSSMEELHYSSTAPFAEWIRNAVGDSREYMRKLTGTTLQIGQSGGTIIASINQFTAHNFNGAVTVAGIPLTLPVLTGLPTNNGHIFLNSASNCVVWRSGGSNFKAVGVLA